ncbi:hypothetical protein [Parahaliea aestuarii]|uniref:Peroxidase n=1 Tax=Parahaliea aestuarii TaxID=1852021 RepID=A0A5C8ZPM8_9GAMM|nr:hypothetical protein [Parahaliea aestuarii]TXS90418.1 hypothetical protein FVW59_13830 [Parahaliea aestuarii]
MTPQSTLMIAAPVSSGRENALGALLATLNRRPGEADPDNPLVPFGQFGQLHMARFTLLYARTNDDIRAHGVRPRPWPPTLVFIADVDGDTDRFLAELCLRAGDGLRQIFSHCRDFDAGYDDLLPWMRRRNRRPAASYVNWRGRSVQQVREEEALACFVRRHLAATQGESDDARAVHGRLREAVLEEVAELRLRLSPAAPTPAGWWLGNLVHLLAIPLAGLLLLPLLLLLAPLYLWRLRQLERSDPENTRPPEPQHLQALLAVEDFDVTNHFNVFGQVKPGLLRLLTIKAGLLLLDYTSRHIYRRGYLTRIRTIHFAHWVLLDGNARVYFASNYDGSAESYMDDFINKVAWGLNLVFSNGIGYPRTRFLLKGGAEHEGNYKATLRRNQLPSESWYKAYPGLTAVDLARNHQIRAVLEEARPGEQVLRDWVGLL